MLTLRAYGLLLDEPSARVLVCDELIRGQRITKFPGGGLEFGEGLRDCLVREVREEMGLEALDVRHFYTTDFFQQSAFHSGPMQVVAVYFIFRVAHPGAIPVAAEPFAGIGAPGGPQEVFRWLPMGLPAEEAVTLPIDRHVWRLLALGQR